MPSQRKPLSREASPRFTKMIPLLGQIPEGIIVDLACGYGRNGLVFVRSGREVLFIDKDHDALESIVNQNRQRGLNMNLIKTVRMDFNVEEPFFLSKSLAGLIVVHYFNEHLIGNILHKIKDGGFLYYESIDDRRGNYLELPRRGWFDEQMSGNFKVLEYNQRVSKHDPNKCTVNILAIKSES